MCKAQPIANGNFNENGARVTYYCDPGYTMSGTPTLKCNTTSKDYSGFMPVCSLEFLKEPIPNGYMNSNGDSVSYYCKAAYTMSGSPSLTCVNGTWIGTIPTCRLEFLDSAWFWVLIALLSLALLGCLAWLLCRRWCGCCGYGRGRRSARAPMDDEYEDDCCQGCCQAPGASHEGCCDYYGCCGYSGCCACCCWCCRCCREPIQPDTELRIIKSTNPKSKSVLSVRKKNWFNIRRKQKTKPTTVPKLELSKINKIRVIRRNSTGTLPTTRTVQSLVSQESDKFRRVAKIVPVWMPHSQPVRDINTSTK